MENFSQATDAAKASIDSQGSAIAENDKRLESFESKINNIKGAWQELILNIADSDKIKDLLDTVNNLLRGIANNQVAIDALVTIAKTLLILKGLQIGKDIFSGFITSAKDAIAIGGQVITKVKKIIGVLKDLPIIIASIHDVVKTLGVTGALARLAPALASIAPYAAVFIGLGTAVGFASGKFQELYNQHIAETSDDLNKVADAYLNLVKAQKEFTHPSKGVGVKNVTGQEALDILIEKTSELTSQYNIGAIAAEDFLDKIGDVEPLVSYYESLQNIIDSGGTLTKTQQENYDKLTLLVGAYKGATKQLDDTKASTDELRDATGKLNGVYSSSQSIYSVYKDQLTQVGNTYYFVSQAAKDSAIATQKAIIAEAESVIENTKNEIKARKALIEVMATDLPITKALGDATKDTKLLSQTEFESSLIKQNREKIKVAEDALAEINKIKVRGVSGDTGSGDGGGGGSDTKQKKDYLSTYKKQLESYQKAQEEAYKKGEITADQYYTNVRKYGEAYYKKLKAMGSDYADDAKSMYQAYKDANTDAVKGIFEEIEYRYKEGTIDGQKYYEQVWKYAKKFYKNGKLDFDSYRSYIKKGYEAMFDNIKKQYESGQITAEQYMSKVKKAQSKASSSISSAAKSGTIKGNTITETRNALVAASVAAKNAAAKALKEAAIAAAEAAVEAAQKKLEEAQKRQEKANTFISALQFWADEQTEAIDKTIDGYNEQIDKLNEQLDLMDEQNDALDKQAERIKLVNALEEAKKQKTVRVYDSSLGWVA